MDSLCPPRQGASARDSAPRRLTGFRVPPHACEIRAFAPCASHPWYRMHIVRRMRRHAAHSGILTSPNLGFSAPWMAPSVTGEQGSQPHRFANSAPSRRSPVRTTGSSIPMASITSGMKPYPPADQAPARKAGISTPIPFKGVRPLKGRSCARDVGKLSVPGAASTPVSGGEIGVTGDWFPGGMGSRRNAARWGAGKRAVADDAEWLSNRRQKGGFAYSAPANTKT